MGENMKYGVLLLSVIFIGCSSDSSGGGSGDFSPFAGIWLEKNDAEELRTTGALESLCEDLKDNPGLTIENMRFVEGDGSLYTYVPEDISVKNRKLGLLEDSGNFIPSASYKEGLNGTTMSASIASDELTLTYNSKNASYAMQFLRSSINEAKAYYAAQEACRE